MAEHQDSIPTLILRNVERKPDGVALRYISESISKNDETTSCILPSIEWNYKEIWLASSSIASSLLQRLRSHGTISSYFNFPSSPPLRQHRIGVMIDEGPFLPLLQLAILMSNLIIVPLDSNDPRFRFAIEDALPILIITKDEQTSKLTQEVLSSLSSPSASSSSHSSSSSSSSSSPSTSSSSFFPSSSTSSSSSSVVFSSIEVITIQSLVPNVFPLFNENKKKITTSSTPSPLLENSSLQTSSPSSSSTPSISHIFFTSGSTGKPKGCVISHTALLNYCQTKNQVHEIDSSSVCFVASSLTFDPSMGDFFSTWCAGGVLALAPRNLTFSSLGFCLLASKATHVLTTPSLFNTVSNSSSSPLFTPDTLTDLKVIGLGGEATTKNIVDVWGSHPRITLINTYGVTECCVYQAAAIINPDSISPKLLGNPLPGNQLLVMRSKEPTTSSSPSGSVENFEEVAVESGEKGELWISGAQVGEGYLNLPELTSQRFVFHSVYGKCFRTGDLVISTSLSSVTEKYEKTKKDMKVGFGWKLLGRSDDQVKIRGQRVELGEIEESILAVTSPWLITSMVVVISTHSTTEGQLISFSVPSFTTTTQVRELLSQLLRLLSEERLPRHMVPSRFIFVSNIPTTRTGKIAKSVLAKQQLPPIQPTSLISPSEEDALSLVDPADSFWRSLVLDSWTKTLGLESGLFSTISDVHFLELGGDSLSALRACQILAQRIEEFHIKPRKEKEKEDREGMLLDNRNEGEGRKGAETNGKVLKNNSGEFGDLLGSLGPAELLKRPQLFDFAQHIRENFNSEEERTSPPSSSPSSAASTSILPDIETKLLRLLYRSASLGSEHTIKFLLEQQKLDPDGKHSSPSSAASSWRRHFSPLHTACANSQFNTAIELLERGASPSLSSDPNGLQPIHFAAQKGPLECLEALMLPSSSVSSTSSYRYFFSKQRDATHPLPINPSILFAKDDNLQTVLHHAARANAPGKVMDFLLEKWLGGSSGKGGGGKGGSGVSSTVDCLDKWQRTPLHWAVVNGHRTMVLKLLSSGADRKRLDENNETPLEIAERRARCGAKERPNGMGASVFGDIAKLLGGSGSTKQVLQYLK